MSRKTTFLIILIVVSLFVGGLTGFYFYSQNKTQPTTILGQSTTGRTFGGYTPSTPNTSSNLDDTLQISNQETSSTTPTIPKLRKISSEPVSGADFVKAPIYDETTKNIEPEDTSRTNGVIKTIKPKLIGYKDIIRFMERATGNIYETSTSTLEKTRISNTTIPKIYETYFVNNGDSMILRDLVGDTDIIRTRYGVLALATTTDSKKSLVTSNLASKISQIAVSPTKDRLVSVLDEGVTAFISKADGSNKQTILNIPFHEWLVSWPEKNTILFTTKPTGFYPGYAYEINPNTQSFTRVLGDINGLTTLESPDATKIIFSKSEYGSLGLYILNKKTGDIQNLNVRTLPEKCVWSKTNKDILYCAIPQDIAFNTYPDVWYQGRITFSDNLWMLNVATGETRQLINLQQESGEVIDVQSITVDSDDSYLLFTDKNSLSLWGYLLKEPPKPAFNPIIDQGQSTTTSTQ